MKRSLYIVGDDDKPHRIVTYEMKNGACVADWNKDGESFFRPQIESEGIITASGLLKQNDGKKFFDALKIAYTNSSHMFVEDS